jgi:hypothetical protein
MSLLFTESFMAYPKFTGTGGTTADNTARAAYLANNSMFGMTWSQHTSNQTNGVIPAVAADPLNPDRNVVYANAQAGVTGAGSGKLIVRLDQDGSRAVVGGFSLYITAAAYGLQTPTATYIEVYLGSGSTRAFIITRDGRVTDHDSVAQSTKKLVADTLGFYEFRYYRNELRVWLDDVLVLQKTGVWWTDVLDIRLSYAAAANITTVYYVGNLYVLVEDDVMPNQRLGPTTRVIGRRPGTDAQAQWIRSSGPSNASVAAQDPNANPTNQLQTDTVGVADFYNPVADATTQGASLVHAVMTRALVGNIDPIGHTFDCGVRVGTDVDYGNNFAPSMFQKYSTPWAQTKYLYSTLERTNGRLLIGGTGPCLYVLKFAGAGPLGWAQVMEGALAAYFVAIVENSVGRLFALTDTGLLYTCAPGADETIGANWIAKTSPGTNTWRDLIVGANDHLLCVKTTNGFTFRSVDDGTTWVPGNHPATRSNCGICYANGQYVMVANNAGVAYTYTSADGLTWTQRTLIASGWPSVAGDLMTVTYGNGVYVAGGTIAVTSGDLHVYTSPDAITWTKTTVTLKSAANIAASGVSRIIFVDGRFIATATGSNSPMWSPDGVSWERFQIEGFISQPLYPFCAPDDGYIVVLNYPGNFRRFTKVNEKTLVEALTNKLLIRNINMNPQTDVAWTGAEAAAAEFGMKLTS